MGGGVTLAGLRTSALIGAILALSSAVSAAAKPALWVVRSADTEITLYGTVHALSKGIDWLTPVAAARLDAADSLVVEAVIPDDRFAVGEVMTRLGMPPGLKPLSTRVPKPLGREVERAAATAGVSIALLDRMEPWLAAITLSEAALERQGINPADGVEPALTVRARRAAKPVVGLETVEQQLRYFDALAIPDQTALLKATVEDLDTAKADTDRLLALWQKGDVDAIARDFSHEARASPNLMKVLLTERNARWVGWIAGAMRTPGKVFLAVGAGHFGGAQGLIALLRARGLQVERIE